MSLDREICIRMREFQSTMNSKYVAERSRGNNTVKIDFSFFIVNLNKMNK